MNGLLHHIEIYVSDIRKTIQFWEWLLVEKFHYTKFQEWEDGVSYRLNSTYIVFVQTGKKYLEASYNRKNIGLNHIAFHCDSENFVDSLTEQLKQKNISILYLDKHPFAGGKDCYAVYFEDPDRIKVEIVVSPSFKIV